MVRDFMDAQEIPYLENCNLREKTYFKSEGFVRLISYPKNKEQLRIIIIYLSQNNIDYKIIGETTNLLFLDSIYYGLFISTKFIDGLLIDNNKVTVDSGRSLPDFVRFLASHAFGGLEGLEGIPGTIGGALFMNAGAYGYKISDHIDSVMCIKKNGDIIELKKKNCSFSERSSIFKQNSEFVILSATFKLNVSDQKKIEENIHRYHIARHSYQEWSLPNLGSAFVCPNGVYNSIVFDKKINKFQFILTKKIFFNKFSRFLNRKKPSYKKLNYLIIKNHNLSYFYLCQTDKNINTIVNRGQSSLDTINYLYKLKTIFSSDVSLENEIVNQCIFKVKNEEAYINTVKLIAKIK